MAPKAKGKSKSAKSKAKSKLGDKTGAEERPSDAVGRQKGRGGRRKARKLLLAPLWGWAIAPF